MPGLNEPLGRPLRMGLIGGGGAGFIGKVHAVAGTLDHRARLVAGALSSDPERARAAGQQFGIESDRSYSSVEELIDRESQLPRDKRIDFVTIATPNHTHYPIARQALEAGFHVVCDKPLTNSLDEARQLVDLVEAAPGRVFALTHNYSGYPLIRQARDWIAAGRLGDILAVRVAYLQGWLTTLNDLQTAARGVWKSDPNLAGSGTLGDIGTHAYQLLQFTTGWQPRELSALLGNFHPQRRLDDYGQINLRSKTQACLGQITISQMSHGRLNNVSLQIDGTKASLEWQQEDPNRLILRQQGGPDEVYHRNPNASHLSDAARAASRIPGGHPEGFFEAFANVYRAFFDDVARAECGATFDAHSSLYPTVRDGLTGVEFVTQCLASHEADAAWVPIGVPA